MYTDFKHRECENTMDGYKTTQIGFGFNWIWLERHYDTN